jgi:hypothetical protein
MAVYRSRLGIAASASVALFFALTHCGGDDKSGAASTSPDGGGVDGSVTTGLGDGSVASSTSDEYYQCTSGELERCTASTPATETCGSRDECSPDTPCKSAECACPGGGSVNITPESRCQAGCCTEVATTCARACANVDAGAGDAGSFDEPPPGGVLKVAPTCTTWEASSSCAGRTICSDYVDAGCTPELATCSSASTSVVPAPLCRGSETGSSKIYPSTCSPELHVVSVYESEDRAKPEIPVEVDRPNVPIVLALNAFQPIRWIVTAKENVQLKRIVLFNGDKASVVAPSGVPVTFLHRLICAFDFEEGKDTCRISDAVVSAESASGLHASSVQGCYYGTSFALR